METVLVDCYTKQDVPWFAGSNLEWGDEFTKKATQDAA